MSLEDLRRQLREAQTRAQKRLDAGEIAGPKNRGGRKSKKAPPAAPKNPEADAAGDDGLTYEEKERKRKREYDKNRRLTENDVAYVSRDPKWDKLHEACRDDLERWLVDVFPETTGLKPFGRLQRQSIETVQHCILHGGRFCDAEPRSFVKTTRAAYSALWALCYGHRRCIPLFACNQKKAKDLLAKIRAPIRTSDQFRGMFPTLAACCDAVRLKPHRAKWQTCNGNYTGVKWSTQEIFFPTVKDPATNERKEYSGAVVTCLPIASARGINLTNEETGESLRPDFFFLDDIQTDGIAKNPDRVSDMCDIVKTVVLHLNGLSYTMAGIMAATCKEVGDVTERFLDDGSWQRLRISHFITRAKNEHLWLGEYKRIREDWDESSPGSQRDAHLRALQFYKDHRAEMDEGAEAAWEWAYAWQSDTEISAIQRGYNILIDDEIKAWASEVMNDPKLAIAKNETRVLTASEIEAKQATDCPRFSIPNECHTVVTGFDIQERALYWLVAAFGHGFTGGVVDYGIFPEQDSLDVPYSRLAVTFDDLWPGELPSAQVFKALEIITEELGARSYVRLGDNLELPTKRIIIDRGFETDAVDKFCRMSKLANIVLPSAGIGIKAGDTPMEIRNVKDNETAGDAWMKKATKNDSRIQYLQIDTNTWKTRIHNGLRAGFAAPGCFHLFAEQVTGQHETLASHISAERYNRTFGKGRWVNEFRLIPGRDNHWLDCLVECFAGASEAGVSFEHSAARKAAARRRAIRKTFSNWSKG